MENHNWKIYTKKGDQGETSLIGGSRVMKSDDRIDAYGTLDELNSFVGLIRDFALETEIREVLYEIQCCIFTGESLLAVDSAESRSQMPKISENNILLLEKEIDRMNEKLTVLQNFILPGGHPLISYCHIARTVCRRAERLIVKLKPEEENLLITLKYINRLSDYLFVLARFYAHEFKIGETIWKSS
jgi:cob(I)alamin adenosyltransferase